MVNKYKRKTNRASWSEDTMALAIREAQNNPVKTTARKYGIPLATLQRHLKTGSSNKKLGRFKSVFNEEQEEELLEYIFHMDSLFYGLSKKEFLKLVFQYADKNNIKHPFKNGTAGEDWYINFRKRHPSVTLRKPEPTSIARAKGFNKPQVYRFFDLIESQIKEHGVDATRIYNMDETGIQTSSNKPPMILTKSGKRQVGLIASLEKGKTTTVICCCNAAGAFIPPFLIYARKKMAQRLLDDAPPGTQASCSDSGWTNGPIFLEWLRFFAETTRPSTERKIILILDNHESHKYYPALEFASKNNIIFISLAPHTTHRMQPLDYCIYGPLKIYFEQTVAAFQKAHANRVINQSDVAGLFKQAYLKAATAQNAVNGFNKTGLWPPNRYIFNESDFLPASVTESLPDDPIIESCQQNETPPILAQTEGQQSSLPLQLDSIPCSSRMSDVVQTSYVHDDHDIDRTPSPSVLDEIIRAQDTCMPTALLVDDDCIVSKTISDPTDVISTDMDIEEAEISALPEKDLIPSSSKIVQKTPPPTMSASDLPVLQAETELVDNPGLHKSPLMLRPVPKVAQNKTGRRRKAQKAEILTNTPNKEEQKIKFEKKQKCNKESKRYFNRKGKTKGKGKNKENKVPKTTKKPKWYCLFCQEPYQTPITEDWICCDGCKMWAHEQCSSYLGIGSFFCDACQET